MSSELENLYKKCNININEIEKNYGKESLGSNVLFAVSSEIDNDGKMKFVTKSFSIEKSINIESVYSKELKTRSAFINEIDAINHIKFLNDLNDVIHAAVLVNEQTGYSPDYNNDNEKKYIIIYNQNDGMLNVDYTYSVVYSSIDSCLSFKTNQIANNFISSFKEKLLRVVRYKLEMMY